MPGTFKMANLYSINEWVVNGSSWFFCSDFADSTERSQYPEMSHMGEIMVASAPILAPRTSTLGVESCCPRLVLDVGSVSGAPVVICLSKIQSMDDLFFFLPVFCFQAQP